MQITSEPHESRQQQLTIVVPPERIERAMRDAAQAFAKHIRVSGYRPGKVPMHRVIAHVGEDAVREEALERLTEEVVAEAIRQEALEPSGPTSVEKVEDDPLTLRAVVPLQPEVELGEYRDLRIEEPEATEVTEDDVTEVLERLQRDLATEETVERPAEAEDTVELSLVGRLDDEIVYEEQALDLVLEADGAAAANLPPEVVDEIVGLAAGDDHSFSVTYSEFWPQPELANQEATFEATVVAVRTAVEPPLDDELAKKMGGVDTLDDLRERIGAQLESRAGIEAREAHVTAAVEALVSSASVTYPPVLVDTEVANIVADLRTRVERQGFDWERWMELQQTDQQAMWAQAEPEAKSRLEQRLVLREFVTAEDIEVSEEEIDDEVQRLNAMLGRQAPKRGPGLDALRSSTGSRLLSDRAIGRLLAILSGGGDDEAVAEPGPDAEDERSTEHRTAPETSP